jgi:hypothetical protein
VFPLRGWLKIWEQIMFRTALIIFVMFASPTLAQTRFNDFFSHGPDGSFGKALADAKAARDKRDAMVEAGTLAADGDYIAARNLLLRRGYLTEAAYFENMWKASNLEKVRKDSKQP